MDTATAFPGASVTYKQDATEITLTYPGHRHLLVLDPSDPAEILAVTFLAAVEKFLLYVEEETVKQLDNVRYDIYLLRTGVERVFSDHV